MVWKITKQADEMEPLPGVPWRDMEDSEFKEISAMYSSTGFPSKSLDHSGFFEHVEDKPKATEEKT